MAPPITTRALAGDVDFHRVREFLVATYPLGPIRHHNWETRRWDGWFWYRSDAELADPAPWLSLVGLWGDRSGRLLGVMIPESGRSELHVQIHPDHRDLEDDMYAWAEDHLGDRADDGTCRIVTWAFDADRARRRVLERRGYRITDAFGFSRSRTLAAPIPDAPVAAGYTVRGLRPGDEEDGDRWADVVRAVFAHVGPGSAQGERNFRRHSPGYDPGLHLFAEAAGGGFAAFAGLTVDESNRFAQFEPVGTHPDHLRLGLARAVMAEGMRRLRDRGHADLVYVGTGSAVPANRLYRALGFGYEQVEHAWEKVW